MVKLIFGKNKNVKLSKSEYENLLQTYGRENALDYIQHLDSFIKSTRSVYPSHYEALKDLLTKDKIKRKLSVEEIFMVYDGTNEEEIKKVRIYNQTQLCLYCKAKVNFERLHKLKVGKCPCAIYSCECGATYCEEYIEKERMLYWSGTSKGGGWEEINFEVKVGDRVEMKDGTIIDIKSVNGYFLEDTNGNTWMENDVFAINGEIVNGEIVNGDTQKGAVALSINGERV